MKEKITQLRAKINQLQLDGLLITNLVNIQYLTGFNGSNAIAYVSQDELLLLTDFRYEVMAKEKVINDFEVKIVNRNLLGAIDFISKNNKVGVEDSLSIGQFETINTMLPNVFVSTSDIIEQLRQIKTPAEIAKITTSVNHIVDGYNDAIKSIKIDQTTEKQIATHLYNYGAENNCQGFSFDPIVASGLNGALPHAEYSDKIITSGELVTVDCGYIYDSYCSDITRTFQVGQTLNFVELQKMYQIVLEANELALQAIKPGMKCCDIDKIARDHITNAGYGEYFGHGLGHSFGLEVHEAPYFNSTDQTILQPGMIMTVEPGIYIEGIGGIRIEDDILITKDGCDILTKNLSKELLIIQ